MQIDKVSEKAPDRELARENIQKAVVARPYYLQDCVNTPLLYWSHNLVHNSCPKPYENEFGADPENVRTLLISIFNSGGNVRLTINNFLDIHYSGYCNTLMANESEQPFFDYLVNLAEDRKDEFKRNSYRNLRQWISTHNDYKSSQPSGERQPEKARPQHSLTLRQIALVLYRNGLPSEGADAKELMKSNGQTLTNKMRGFYNDYQKSAKSKLTDIEGKRQTDQRKDLIAALPYLDKKAKEEAEKELLDAFPEINIPV